MCILHHAGRAPNKDSKRFMVQSLSDFRASPKKISKPLRDVAAHPTMTSKLKEADPVIVALGYACELAVECAHKSLNQGRWFIGAVALASTWNRG